MHHTACSARSLFSAAPFTRCDTLEHAATHVQHAVTLQHIAGSSRRLCSASPQTLQHSAKHCIVLQHIPHAVSSCFSPCIHPQCIFAFWLLLLLNMCACACARVYACICVFAHAHGHPRFLYNLIITFAEFTSPQKDFFSQTDRLLFPTRKTSSLNTSRPLALG